MPIRITCPSCSAVLSVKDENAGRAVKCPKCDGVIPVPAPAPVAPAPAPRNDFDDLDEPAPKRPARSSPDRKPARSRYDEDDEDESDGYDDRPRGRRPNKSGGGLGEFLTFRKMVVPVVIQIIFWFLTLVVLGVAAVFAAIQVASGKTENVAMGLAGLVVGAPLYILLIRMYCEVLIVIFRMNDTLTDIRSLLERRHD